MPEPRRTRIVRHPRSALVQRARARHDRDVPPVEPTEPDAGPTLLDEAVGVSDAPTTRPSGPPDARTMLRDFLRPGRGQLALAVVLCLVALGVVTQIRTHATDDTYASMRRQDLLVLLDQLNTNNQTLQNEIDKLNQTKTDLQSGADKAKLAQQQAQQRLQQLQILAGTAPAEGPGVVITISDPRHKVTAALLLDAVEEMRDAGAEAIQINDVRVVAATWFAPGPDGTLLVDGKQVSAPFVLSVIGEPTALVEGARFRGGMVAQAQAPEVGAVVTIETPAVVRVTALREVRAPQYATPTQP